MILQIAKHHALHLVKGWVKEEADLQMRLQLTSQYIYLIYPWAWMVTQLHQIVGRESSFCILISTSHWLLAATEDSMTLSEPSPDINSNIRWRTYFAYFLLYVCFMLVLWIYRIYFKCWILMLYMLLFFFFSLTLIFSLNSVFEVTKSVKVDKHQFSNLEFVHFIF